MRYKTVWLDPASKWKHGDSHAGEGYLLCDITGNWSRHQCFFGPVSKCSLLVVDVSESWLEVAANNSRPSRRNVNYTSAELAQDVNREPCHWGIRTCCTHGRSAPLVRRHQKSAWDLKEVAAPACCSLNSSVPGETHCGTLLSCVWEYHYDMKLYDLDPVFGHQLLAESNGKWRSILFVRSRKSWDSGCLWLKFANRRHIQCRKKSNHTELFMEKMKGPHQQHPCQHCHLIPFLFSEDHCH